MAAMARRRADGVTESCALDVADRGPHSHEQVATYLGVDKQAIQQFEEYAMPKLAKKFRKLRGSIDE
jgi:DNA-directed RNA polymerase sigma subunit (sigma70/sigma32)